MDTMENALVLALAAIIEDVANGPVLGAGEGSSCCNSREVYYSTCGDPNHSICTGCLVGTLKNNEPAYTGYLINPYFKKFDEKYS